MLEQNTLEVMTPANTAEEPVTSTAVPPPLEVPAEVDIGVMYVEYRMLLLSVGCRKFRIPECEAENLIQDKATAASLMARAVCLPNRPSRAGR